MSWSHLPKELEARVVGEISTTTAIKEKQNKYGVARKEDRTYNNIVFASKKEMLRYKDLFLLSLSGKIKNFLIQPSFLLQDSFEYKNKKYRAIYYVADFQYDENGITIIEDVKGKKTKEYEIKKKLLLKKYPEINFIES